MGRGLGSGGESKNKYPNGTFTSWANFSAWVGVSLPSSIRLARLEILDATSARVARPTAEQVFGGRGFETDSAGLAPDADCQLSAEQLEWADLVFVMEKQHRTRLQQRFATQLRGTKIVCLDVPDRYEFMQPELVTLLEKKVGQHLREGAKDASQKNRREL